jgi:hypothetical protein
MLDEATGGRVDLFALPNVRSAGLFARRMEITPGQYPAFADCTVGSQPNASIMGYVTRRFGLPPAAAELKGHPAPRWLDEWGVFAFALDESQEDGQVAVPAVRDWFQDAGILICRGATTEDDAPFAVALKGGHNAEHHNHNDVGSYVVCIGPDMPLVDPGAEVYTRRTFSRDRYVSGVLNSLGHPVPRIDGQLQRAGRSAAGKVVAREFTDEADTVRLDYTSAYAVKSLERLQRTFVYRRLPEPGLSVTDEVAFSAPTSFGTAVITFGSWKQVGENRLRISHGRNAVEIEIQAGGLPVRIQATEIREDVRGGKTPVRVGIDLVEPVREATIQLWIRPVSARG